EIVGPQLCAGFEWRKQAEIDVHRLEGTLAGLVVGDDMAAGDVAEQRAKGRGGGWNRNGLSEPSGRSEATRQKADGRALDIAFAARDLSGKAQAGARLQLQAAVEQRRRVDVGVA